MCKKRQNSCLVSLFAGLAVTLEEAFKYPDAQGRGLRVFLPCFFDDDTDRHVANLVVILRSSPLGENEYFKSLISEYDQNPILEREKFVSCANRYFIDSDLHLEEGCIDHSALAQIGREIGQRVFSEIGGLLESAVRALYQNLSTVDPTRNPGIVFVAN